MFLDDKVRSTAETDDISGSDTQFFLLRCINSCLYLYSQLVSPQEQEGKTLILIQVVI